MFCNTLSGKIFVVIILPQKNNVCKITIFKFSQIPRSQVSAVGKSFFFFFKLDDFTTL